VRLDDAPAYRQAEAHARRGSRRVMELGEDLLLLPGWHSCTGIGDLDLDPVVHAARVELQRRLVRRVLDRVLDEIDESCAPATGVATIR
jgi:hypothetical protein